MDSEQDEAMRIATFRFSVIADLVTGRRHAYGDRTRLLLEKTKQEYDIPSSARTRVSRATIISWIRRYKSAGNSIEGLKPKARVDKGKYRNLDATLCMAIRDLKKEDPTYTLKVIVTKLRQNRVLGAHDIINKSSIYRFIKNEGLDMTTTETVDRRRFEAEFPNDIWQCDVMHGPDVKVEGNASKKSFLCAIIDDHSRLIVHAQFYTDETLDSLKDCLRQAILKRGLPQKFYTDNGACYRAGNLEQCLALLGVSLSHSRPYTPQGRGKIERWFGSVRQTFLPLYGRDRVSLAELNERLDSWVDEYNDSDHSSIQMSPLTRFKKNLSCVRPAPENLNSYFRLVEIRHVKKDRTVHLHNRVFEVAVRLIDKKVELRYHRDTPLDVEVFFENRSFGKAVPLDANLNAKLGRDYERSLPPKEVKVTDAHATLPQTGKLFNGQEASQ